LQEQELMTVSQPQHLSHPQHLLLLLLPGCFCPAAPLLLQLLLLLQHH
jgi:hypothetical protein